LSQACAEPRRWRWNPTNSAWVNRERFFKPSRASARLHLQGSGTDAPGPDHRSFAGRNNERLEFLGDAILNFVAGEALFDRFPQAREGQLSRLRAVVKGETLAVLARGFDLGEYLRLGSGELKSGGFRRESILADALEALIGAIYLDAGMEVPRERVLAWLAGEFEGLTLVDTNKDPKTRLQEFLQSRGASCRATKWWISRVSRIAGRSSSNAKWSY
jgi:dsRNA-specific ribonuclease